MRALFGNNCAKGCFIYVIAVVAIIVVASMGLGGLRAKFGGAAVEGNAPQYTIQSTGQTANQTTSSTPPNNQPSSVADPLGGGGGIVPTPTTAPVVVVPPVLNATLVPAQGQGGTITSDGGDSFYIVQSGDTLWGIAKNFGVDLDALTSLNGLSDSIIYAGQVLYLPTSSQQQVTLPAPTAVSGGGSSDAGAPPVPSMPDTGINAKP